MNRKNMNPVDSGRRSFSVVDVAIILVVIASLAGLVLRWVTDTVELETSYEGEAYVVTYKVMETHRDILGSVANGDTVYVSEGDAYIGYLDGKPSLTPAVGHPDRATGVGHMRCNGQMENGTLLLKKSGISLTPGTIIEVHTERARLTLTVTDIVPVS